MHYYVRDVIGKICPSDSNGRGGYLRIKSDADQERACILLAEERDAAQAEVDSARISGPLLNYGIPMQMLILTELILANPTEPVDIRAVSMAQGHGSGYVSERIEDAAKGLVMLSRQLEVVESL